MTAAVPVAPRSWHLASRPQNTCCLQAWIPHTCRSCYGSLKPMPQHKYTTGPPMHSGHQTIQACQFFCSKGTLNLLLSSSSPLSHTQVNSRFQALLFCWYQEVSLPTEHRCPVLTTKLSYGKAPAASSKSGNPALPLSGNLPFCGYQDSYFPKAQKVPALPHCPTMGRPLILC
jgi:hypothetical protein